MDDEIWEEYERGIRSAFGKSPGLNVEEIVRERRASLAMGAVLPLFRDVLGDADGNVWLAEYTVLDPIMGGFSASYLVVSKDGQLVGTVVLPERFKPLDIGSDLIVGVERNDLDVEAVAVYRIEKVQLQQP